MQKRAGSGFQLLWAILWMLPPSASYRSQGRGSWPQSHDQRIFQSDVPNIVRVMRGWVTRQLWHWYIMDSNDENQNTIWER